MTQQTAPSGWYTDPQQPGVMRYFDGWAWTGHTAPAGTVAPSTPGLGASPSDPVHWLVPTGRSWQSITAGYLGLVALFVWFVGPVAVAMGIWALSEAKHSSGHGRGRAWFAIAAGVFGSAMGAWFISVR